jgi:hypothetical protein
MKYSYEIKRIEHQKRSKTKIRYRLYIQSDDRKDNIYNDPAINCVGNGNIENTSLRRHYCINHEYDTIKEAYFAGVEYIAKKIAEDEWKKLSKKNNKNNIVLSGKFGEVE